MDNIVIVPIQECSISHLQILELYSQLTSAPKISVEQFRQFVNSLYFSEKIYVMQRENTIIGLGTIILEPKLIHGISKVGHIEDLVISNNFRGQGYGKYMIDFLTNIAKQEGCYKVILNCSENNRVFYEKCGYTQKNIEMSLYF